MQNLSISLPEEVFSAYQLNGKTLPLKHGFPLRVVAEGYYGYDWIKRVQRIRADKIQWTPEPKPS